MKKSSFTFITGGSRSGKSSHALALAESLGEKRLFIATARALDAEMEERISRHRKERGHGWDTAEEPLHVADVIEKTGNYDVVLLDCLTLWLCNVMHRADSGDDSFEATHLFFPPCQGGTEGGESSEAEEVLKKIDQLVQACLKCSNDIIVISNETGSGIIPDNAASRYFSDLAGLMNQKMAAAANRVILTVAGIPMTIKG